VLEARAACLVFGIFPQIRRPFLFVDLLLPGAAHEVTMITGSHVAMMGMQIHMQVHPEQARTSTGLILKVR
jgi:hypothetical protein